MLTIIHSSANIHVCLLLTSKNNTASLKNSTGVFFQLCPISLELRGKGNGAARILLAILTVAVMLLSMQTCYCIAPLTMDTRPPNIRVVYFLIFDGYPTFLHIVVMTILVFVQMLSMLGASYFSRF